MRQYSLSSNIEQNAMGCEHYVVTANTRDVALRITQDFRDSFHAFLLIGTYGTGKSTFLLQFERDLCGEGGELLVGAAEKWAGVSGCKCLNIVGQYSAFSTVLYQKIQDVLRKDGSSLSRAGYESSTIREDDVPSVDNTLALLDLYYEKVTAQGEMLFIAIDEFGKMLEHAAKHEVESELYFVQQLAEWVNVPERKVMLLLSMHQSMEAYGLGTGDLNRFEWQKVQGRFRTIEFKEPVEQLLLLAGQSLSEDFSLDSENKTELNRRIEEIYAVATESKLVNELFSLETARALFPLDACAAVVLASAVQRYGQNSRSIFALLHERGAGSLWERKGLEGKCFNLNDVYEYLIVHFHLAIRQSHVDSPVWQALNMATERVESIDWSTREMLQSALKVVRSIALLQIFGQAGLVLPRVLLERYLLEAMDVADAGKVIDELERLRIIRFAIYRQRYVLFEGTDFNIEAEVAKAETIIPVSDAIAEELRQYVGDVVVSVREHYYRTGTPRCFLQTVVSEPRDLEPEGEIDGYVQLLFSTDRDVEEIVRRVDEKAKHANIFVIFREMGEIVRRLRRIKAYDYVLKERLQDQNDRVAERELRLSLVYERTQLQQYLEHLLLSGTQSVVWRWGGVDRTVISYRDELRLLSKVCDKIYSQTPILCNELINRHKLSGNISAARIKFLQAMVEHEHEADWGWESDKFPPEKTIYYAMLKNTGLHKVGGFADRPETDDLLSLWCASDNFLQSTRNEARSVSELQKILAAAPYKVKQGVLDFWIPAFLYMRRHDFSLFGREGSYLPEVNLECFELMKKYPADFSIKAYAESGVKIDLFNQYRRFLQIEETEKIGKDKFIETIKPFFSFYHRLNEYAKNTKKFDRIGTVAFRDVLAKAKDPEQAFLEDMPRALGFDPEALGNEEFVSQYSERIAQAVHDLRHCYVDLIARIEAQLVQSLHWQYNDYTSYIKVLRDQLREIKPQLLTPSLKRFVNHALAEFDNRNDWIQSIAFSLLNKPLSQLHDNEEQQLIEQLVHSFAQCEELRVVSRAMDFECAADKTAEIKSVEKRIMKNLSGDDAIDRAVLFQLLKHYIS